MSLHAATKPRPTIAHYKQLAPYTDDETAFANNVLCPRYAESDPTSAPPSPASIESFDVLDSIPWRRSYISLDSGNKEERTCDILRRRLRRNKAKLIALLVLFALFITGCTLGGYFAIKHGQDTFKDGCYSRNGGDRCANLAWAKCVTRSGLGYCEGYM